MYRRSLAASWVAQPDELPADQCIEDIFAGGDGWKGGYAKVSKSTKNIEDSAGVNLQLHRRNRNQSDASMESQSTVKAHHRLGHKHSRSRDMDHPNRIQNPGEQTSSNESERGRSGFRSAHEVDEFEMRDDLVAWKLPEKGL
jgi:hypothetical protein